MAQTDRVAHFVLHDAFVDLVAQLVPNHVVVVSTAVLHSETNDGVVELIGHHDVVSCELGNACFVRIVQLRKKERAIAEHHFGDVSRKVVHVLDAELGANGAHDFVIDCEGTEARLFDHLKALSRLLGTSREVVHAVDFNVVDEVVGTLRNHLAELDVLEVNVGQ